MLAGFGNHVPNLSGGFHFANVGAGVIFDEKKTRGTMGIPDPVRDSQFYQGVPLRRLAAFVIDFFVILVLWLVGVFMGFLLTFMTAGAGGAFAMVLFLGTGFLYRWIMLYQRSATLGMKLTGIEVRTANGEKLNGQMAFLHTAAFFVTFWFMPLLLIGWVLMFSSPHRRAMHDLPLGTVVINRPT